MSERLPYLSLHVVGAVRRGPGQEGGQVRVQRALWLGAERQHFEARVQPPQLLLQAGRGTQEQDDDTTTTTTTTPPMNDK